MRFAAFAVIMIGVVTTASAQSPDRTKSAPAAPVRGGYTILESNVASLPRDGKLTKGAEIEIPSGHEIKLVDHNSPADVQRTCAGPYKGKIDNCTGPSKCGFVWRILNMCGGSGEDGVRNGTRGTPGGTRGVQ
ncbi:MAG: hypothetical protein AB7O57_01075 [Hyphomicrobiaceae bacterium]